MGSMYKQFKTDNEVENSGVWLKYGDFRIKVARAGRGNKQFVKTVERETRPFRRAIQNEALTPEQDVKIMQEVFVDSVVLNWEVKVGEDENGEPIWEQGIESPEGDTLPYNRANVLKTFKNLPDLFLDIQEMASKMSLFRSDILEEEAKN